MKWAKRQRELERIRKVRARDGRIQVIPFPDLTVPAQVAPVSNSIPGSVSKRQQPEGAKQFPVGHLHKQGMQLIAREDFEWAGGKKP